MDEDAAEENAPDWLNDAIAIHLVPESFADVDVAEYVASVRDQAPTLPKGVAKDGLYLGGVWINKRESREEPGVLVSAFIFYAEMFYKRLELGRALNRAILFGVEDYSYHLDGDRIISVSMAPAWPSELGEDNDGDANPAEPEPDETMRWRYEDGRLDIEGRKWVSYRPSDMAELIASGCPARIVKFIHFLALLGDPDFKERVDALPLRNTPMNQD